MLSTLLANRLTFWFSANSSSSKAMCAIRSIYDASPASRGQQFCRVIVSYSAASRIFAA
jgi:hypothetical protein